MCYHILYLFLTCGHSVPSILPLAHQSSACPATSHILFHKPSLSSAIDPTVDFSYPSPSPWAAAQARRDVEGVSASVRDSSFGETEREENDEVEEEGEREGGKDDTGGRCKEKLSHPLHTYRIDSLCLACLRERDARLARFEVGSIRDDVERAFVKNQQREAASFGGAEVNGVSEKVKELAALRSGYEEGKGSGRGMILDRTGRLDKDGYMRTTASEAMRRHPEIQGHTKPDPEVVRWDPEIGGFEGRDVEAQA